MDMNFMQAISDYGLAIVGCVGAGVAAWKLLHFLLKDVIISLKKQDSIIIDLIDKTARLEIIIQRMDSKLDTLLQKRSSPLLKGDRDKSEDTY
jgi:hypothetical protein|tara:strand:+ start:859 stop:1137 length:279 start_codon:yes stop_codon:yes gene_type:complete